MEEEPGRADPDRAGDPAMEEPPMEPLSGVEPGTWEPPMEELPIEEEPLLAMEEEEGLTLRPKQPVRASTSPRESRIAAKRFIQKRSFLVKWMGAALGEGAPGQGPAPGGARAVPICVFSMLWRGPGHTCRQKFFGWGQAQNAPPLALAEGRGGGRQKTGQKWAGTRPAPARPATLSRR